MKKVMILTAERTGTGHKSAANAIEKRLIELGYETKQVDCFEMMGKLGNSLEKSYIPLTIKCPSIFYIAYLFAQALPNIVHTWIYFRSRRRFKKEITEFKPDIIITVHSMFTKAISHLIKKQRWDIPFFINVIDLVNPPNVWYDNSAKMIFVPTTDVKEQYIKKGMEESKIIVSGFPIRSDIERRKTPKVIEDKVNILMVNPSVNLKKNIEYVKEVSRLENVEVTIICGRDERLYKALKREQDLGKINKEIQIYSFVNNMNEFLENAHILLTKAGPNMLLEGARSATAIVITGHVKGQENNNYEYVVKNDFGFKCENPNEIFEKLNEFIKSKKLDECLTNVLSSECNDGTDVICEHIRHGLIILLATNCNNKKYIFENLE